jgi:hypothetical protein
MSNPSYYVGIAEPGNIIASSTSTSLSFTGLTGGTTYNMYVIGIYANNTITSIGTYSFTTNVITSAPTNATATVVSSSSVSVAFTPPAGTVTSYTVTSSPGSITGTGSASPISVTGLTASTTYTFTVTATNSGGTSPASTASNSVTTLSAYSSGLRWIRFNNYHNEDPNYDSYAQITYISSSGVTNFSSVSTATSGVQGVNASDNYSIFWYGYLLSDFTGLWTFGLTSDDGGWFWIGPNATSGYSTGNANINNGGGHGMNLVATQVSLTSGVYYPVRIMFGEMGGGDDINFFWNRNSSGNSYDFSGKFFDSPPTAPSAPTSVVATVLSSSSISVSFTPPSGTVTSYTVTSSPGSITATGGSTPITVYGLSASTAYTFTVTATNSVGTSPASSPSGSVTTLATGTAPVVPPSSWNTYSVPGIVSYFNQAACAINLDGTCMYNVTYANNIPTGSNTYYIVSSTNAGSTWRTVSFSVGNTNTGGLGACCTDDGGTVFFCHVAGIYRSTDFGLNFSVLTSTYNNAYNIVCSSTASYIYIINAANNYVNVSTNGGTVFTPLTSLPFDGGGTYAISCSDNGQYILFAGSNSPCYVSSNYGTTATLLSGTTDMPPYGQYWQSMSVSTTGQYMLATPTYSSGGVLFTSNNYGVSGSWTQIPRSASDPQGTNSISSTGARNGLFLVKHNQSNAYYSTNTGATWSQCTFTPPKSSRERCWLPNKLSNFHGIMADVEGSQNSSYVNIYYY